MPHLLLGTCVLLWRQVGEEGSAPEQEVDVGILVWLLPALPTAVGCLLVAYLIPLSLPCLVVRNKIMKEIGDKELPIQSLGGVSCLVLSL